MMKWLVESSLKFRFLVLAISAGLMYFGLLQLRDMPIDVFPEFAPPIVEVQTPCLGLSPEEVEELITLPLEESLAGIDNMEVMRSKSVTDLSAIKMYFKRGTDIGVARQHVQERLALAAPNLPVWTFPPVMLPPLSATSRCMKIGISSEKRSVMDLSMITYWTIRQRILQVPGVANVAMWGERLEMLQVQVDPKRMTEHGVTLNEVMEATADSLDVGILTFSDGHHIGTGGWIETPNQRVPIRHVLPIVYKSDEVSPDQLANLVVKLKDGKPILIKDVAEVVIDHQPMIGDGIINDGPGLLLIVEKYPWGNTLQVTRGVEEALEALKPGLPDVDIDSTIFRPATFIETSIHNLSTALWIGCVLVIVVLYVFLYEWRTALISAVAMPLSLVSAALVLYWMGTTINTMILAGFVIALGDIVDDAIIDVENVVRRLREARRDGTSKSTARIILEASLEVRGAIVYATLIEVLAVMPVFFLEGLSGSFFKPLVLSYALALLVSMVVALSVTPALCLILLRGTLLDHQDTRLIRWLQRGYEAMLVRIVRRPSPAYLSVAVLAITGVIVWPMLGQSLLPSFKERDFLMHWLAKPGTSGAEMNRITIQGSKELRAIPGVRNFGAHIGQALIMDEVYGVYFGENWISVDPSVDYDETVNKIQETVDGYPGLFRDVLTYLKERIKEVLTGTSESIVIRIYGRDLPVLREKAAEMKKALEGIEGISELHVEFQEEIPQLEVKVDLNKAHEHGLKPGDVRRAAAFMIAGEEVGDVHIGNRTYDVQVWSTPETRNSVTDLENLLLDSPKGGQVKLKDVADIRIAPTPNIVARENLKRKIDVKANVKGAGDLGVVAAKVQAAMQKVEFPHEYHAEILGEFAERQKAQKRMLMFSVIAVIGIFILLHTSFKSFRLATFAFLTLPSALVGGVLAAYLSDGVISLGSMVGFLTILGIAARNCIMMIDHFQHLEKHEGEPFGPNLVLRGARERLAPIVMTALTTILALAPLLIAGRIPGHEIEYPMAMVILGGMITSTLLNLFVVPPLYLRFAARNAAPSADPAPVPA